ncbi:MAG: CDP-diacylglycerol--glycerol-3-phosphate 3-phosphatidyltransferase [Clostridia bacterium]|nr:CDP-diacylglycerol--glycerol-3-phosphate 3-phosphatidyltransferase [Clostridia bacterium]MDE7337339.1 CDP-diacylglycerol--glycerol-3-phosphate 3-phosphatidyltransferase [Clostridia bacterium]
MKGNTAITLPTKITIVRLVMIPLVILCYCLQPLYEYLFIITAILFIVASLTDFVDGHIARKYNMVSDLGKLLDPIADKVLVATGLFILIDGNYIPEAPYMELICSVIIIAREFMIGVIRQVAALKSVALAADKLGKIKTASTMFALTFLLCSAHSGTVFEVFKYAGAALLIVATIVTVVSGANYVIKNKTLLFGAKQTADGEEENSGENE